MDTKTPDRSVAPALSDADLRETLDLLSTVVASVSDRMDSQTHAIDRLTKTAAETRQAAFAARSQTDPELFAEQAGARMAKSLKPAVDAHTQLVTMLADEIQRLAVLNAEHKAIREDLLKNIRREKAEAERWKKRLPFIAISGLVLVLALGVGLPRFMANNATTCHIIGGEMLVPATGAPACVLVR